MDPPQQQSEAEERVPRGADDEDGGMTPVDSRSGPDLQTTTSSGELHPDEETSACDDDISVADTDLSSVALDEDAQSSMTVTGATASHLKRELLSAMEGKRTIRRLSMAHAADCEEVRGSWTRRLLRAPIAQSCVRKLTLSSCFATPGYSRS